jgi:hypothetical protein
MEIATGEQKKGWLWHATLDKTRKLYAYARISAEQAKAIGETYGRLPAGDMPDLASVKTWDALEAAANSLEKRLEPQIDATLSDEQKKIMKNVRAYQAKAQTQPSQN